MNAAAAQCVGLVSVLLALVGCARNGMFTDAMQADYLSLMEGEAELVGEYLRTREFVTQMKWECREPEQHPYPELFSLLDSMRVLHDLALDNRGEFYQQKVHYDSLRISRRHVNATRQSVHAVSEQSFQNLGRINRRFQQVDARFDSICTAEVIYRVTHGQYADSLLRRIMQWQDSLEWQGRQIAQSRLAFRALGFAASDTVGQQIYAPLSSMEKQHKAFINHVGVVEGHHGRFDRSRPDEYFFRGPRLVPRTDVDKIEAQVDSLAAMHGVFCADLRLFKRRMYAYQRR